jgi:hypothetical protein
MQPKSSPTPSIEGPIPSLEPRDVDTLAYIHSNKFITTRLFHRKFHPTQCYTTASVHLRELVSRGLLLKTRKFQNDETYFYLARPALKYLSGLARILTSPDIRSPRINPIEREHDKRVITMRVQIEQYAGLKGLTWLSDYEMRCGLQMDWKKALAEGRGWHLAGAKLHRVHHRTPDGYFEAEIDGRPYALVLEYEHSAYNRDKMTGMVLNLTRDFPEAFRLVVSRDRNHALRMMAGLETFLRADLQERALWAFSFFEKVDRLPFNRVPWAKLDGGYLPFVKDPILKAVPLPEKQEEVAS